MRTWTKEEEEILRRWYREKMPVVSVAFNLHKTYRQVVNKAHKLGLSPHTAAGKILNINPLESAYLAGLIDGEGTITIAVSKHKDWVEMRPLVAIANTDRRLLDYLKNLLGYSYSASERKPRKENWSSGYLIETRGMKEAYELLRKILPYLIIKREQAETVLTFISHRSFKQKAPLTPKDFEYAIETRRLNLGGPEFQSAERRLKEMQTWYMTSVLNSATSSPTAS